MREKKKAAMIAKKTATIEQMIKIPVERSDLIVIPIFISMYKKIPVELSVTENDIKSPALKMIWNGEPE